MAGPEALAFSQASRIAAKRLLDRQLELGRHEAVLHGRHRPAEIRKRACSRCSACQTDGCSALQDSPLHDVLLLIIIFLYGQNLFMASFPCRECLQAMIPHGCSADVSPAPPSHSERVRPPEFLLLQRIMLHSPVPDPLTAVFSAFLPSYETPALEPFPFADSNLGKANGSLCLQPMKKPRRTHGRAGV